MVGLSPFTRTAPHALALNILMALEEKCITVILPQLELAAPPVMDLNGGTLPGPQGIGSLKHVLENELPRH